MIHPRVRQLADNLISHSIGLKPGEKILIEGFDSRNDFICALVQAVYNAGGMPFVHLKDQSVQRSLLMGLSAAQGGRYRGARSFADGADGRLHRRARRGQHL